MSYLTEGDIIELCEGHRVYADVPEHFLYDNRKGSFKLAHGMVTIGGETAYLAGRYVVYKTANDGGGTGHGPHDVYPNGHHVFCERLDDQSVKCDFYQSGCFTAMVADIAPIGRAVRRWVEPA
jgi:hypothetical protein